MARPVIIPFIIALLIVMMLLAAPAGASVILNTLEGYDDRQPGWSGALDGLFSGSGGNTERVLFETGGQVQWRSERDRWRLQATGSYEESEGTETARNVVAHLRHNRDLSNAWASILFAQVQHNPFQRLRSRWLLGAGVRHDLSESDRGRVTLGATPMLEIERIEDQDGQLAQGRMSIFLHMARHLNATTRLDLVGFWQPLFSDPENWRAVGNLALTIDITGSIDLKVGAAVEDNARPPVGVERTDWSTFAGLGWEF